MPNVSYSDYIRNRFYYKGDFYLRGTKVTLSDDWINSHQFQGKKPWKYMSFDSKIVDGGIVYFFFYSDKTDWMSLEKMGLELKDKNNYALYFSIKALDIEKAIEEITKPIKLDREETEAIKQSLTEPQHDWDNNALVIAWIIYIAAMIGSLIFRQFYILWIIISIIFSQVRKDMLR